MSSQRAETLLRSALTFREASERTSPLPSTFDSKESAISIFVDVLLHEANDAMKEPLSSPPDQPFLSPVDIDTDEPGIVDKKEDLTVKRWPSSSVQRIPYKTRRRREEEGEGDVVLPKIVKLSAEKAEEKAKKEFEKVMKKAERSASAAEERAKNAKIRKEERERETKEEREARLEEGRRKREERKASKGREEQGEEKKEAKRKAQPPPPSEDCLVETDASCPLISSTRKRVKGERVSFFSHPLPHHRHLTAMQKCSPHESISPAVLRGEWSEGVRVVNGPPGTGKTRELVRIAKEEVPSSTRVLLCAPTNVGAVNLYERCLSEGMGEEVSLCLAPERIPPGTVVRSNDPSSRIVCSTISSRSGSVLDSQAFDSVFVDEAAQTQECLVWGLLRDEVRELVMAGDVKQLPPLVSETGSSLHHNRSMMERLLSLGYENVTRLTIQNRMAPSLLSLPNSLFYDDELVCGEFAPKEGGVEVVCLDEAKEEECGSSFSNRTEAEEAVQIASKLKEEGESVVIITPYAAQVKLLLSHRSNVEVHTIDSFQGREADCVVLSCVRDASRGIGFWSEERRWNVALTRAKKRLFVLVSNPSKWEGRVVSSLLDF